MCGGCGSFASGALLPSLLPDPRGFLLPLSPQYVGEGAQC